VKDLGIVPHKASFAGIQDSKVIGSWRLPPRFQKKVRKDRKCVAGLGSLQANPKIVKHDAMRMKPKIQWRFQELESSAFWFSCSKFLCSATYYYDGPKHLKLLVKTKIFSLKL
jgi:hypothetical protein